MAVKITAAVATYWVLSRLALSKYTLIGGPPAWAIKLVNPPRAHHSFPVMALSGLRVVLVFFLGHEFSVKPTAMTPTMIFNHSVENQDAVKPPIITPTIAAGMHFKSCSVFHFFQNFCTVNMSMMQRMGSMMAAASVGEVCNDISGTARMPNAPENPPFETPVINTAIPISEMSNQSIGILVSGGCV